MLMTSYAKRQLILRIKQGTVKNLHLEEIRKCVIPVPTLDEQKELLNELFLLYFAISSTNRRLTTIQNLKHNLVSSQFIP